MADKKVKQKATSSYLRRKENVYKGLDEAGDYGKKKERKTLKESIKEGVKEGMHGEENSLDKQQAKMDREDEERKGITDRIRAIFD